jgi:RHS repeat-associated protein
LSKTDTFSITTTGTTDILWFAGQPIGQWSNGGALRFTITDHLGTPFLQTTNASTPSIVWRAEYEPYGNVYLYRNGTAEEQPLRFPGQEYERLTHAGAEENYNIFRWYSSEWGRYTQPDPVGEFVSPNLFAYTAGSPVNASDPLGLFTWFYGPGPIPSNDVRGDCKDGSRVACSKLLAIQVSCVCQCTADGMWTPRITAFMTVDMRITNQPIRPGMAKDRYIHTRQDAEAHEVRWHLAAAGEALRLVFEPLESPTTEPDCRQRCRSAEALGPHAFTQAYDALMQSQINEHEGKNQWYRY